MSEQQFIVDVLYYAIMTPIEKISVGRSYMAYREVVDLLNKQQSTINELQSIINHIKCEENCEDYDYCCETVCSLYTEIKHLKEENEQLNRKLQSVTMLKDDYEELIESFEKKYGKNIEDVVDDE